MSSKQIQTRSSTPKSVTTTPLSLLSPQEIDTLEILFLELLFSQGFAYTLFGDKPISIHCFGYELSIYQDLSSPAYRIWKKYAHLYPQHNYLFLFFEDPEKETYELTLINKKAFRKIVDQYKELFSIVFGKDIDSDQLLELIVQRGSLWNTPIKEREDLIGLLLGYGQINATLFQKRSEIVRGAHGIKKKRTSPSQGFASVEEELAFLQKTLQGFSEENFFSTQFMRLPSFVADRSHVESKQLKKKYKEQRKQITQLFSQGRILEISLNQLSSN